MGSANARRDEPTDEEIGAATDECKESYKVCMADRDARLIQAIADHPDASISQLCRIANVTHATVERIRKWLRNPYPPSAEGGSESEPAEYEIDRTDKQLDQALHRDDPQQPVKKPTVPQPGSATPTHLSTETKQATAPTEPQQLISVTPANPRIDSWNERVTELVKPNQPAPSPEPTSAAAFDKIATGTIEKLDNILSQLNDDFDILRLVSTDTRKELVAKLRRIAERADELADEAEKAVNENRDGSDKEGNGAATTPLNERRLAKTLALLSSPVDTEVVAAARALERTLKRAGTDYVEVAQKMVAPTRGDPRDELKKRYPWTHGVETHADRANHERKCLEQDIAQLEELVAAELDPAVRARREEKLREKRERQEAEYREKKRAERRRKKLEKQKRLEEEAAREAEERAIEEAYENSPEAQALRPLREKEAALRRQFRELRTKRQSAEQAAASRRSA